jgi:carbonic anhydrase
MQNIMREKTSLNEKEKEYETLKNIQENVEEQLKELKNEEEIILEMIKEEEIKLHRAAMSLEHP